MHLSNKTLQVYSKPIRFVLSLVQAKALGDSQDVVLVADLHGAVPSEVGIYAAHVRNMMETGVLPPLANPVISARSSDIAILPLPQ